MRNTNDIDYFPLEKEDLPRIKSRFRDEYPNGFGMGGYPWFSWVNFWAYAGLTSFITDVIKFIIKNQQYL